MSPNFEDLFDWEKESDRHYYALLDNQMKEEWEQYEQQAAEIKVKKPKKLKKDEIKYNTLPF